MDSRPHCDNLYSLILHKLHGFYHWWNSATDLDWCHRHHKIHHSTSGLCHILLRNCGGTNKRGNFYHERVLKCHTIHSSTFNSSWCHYGGRPRQYKYLESILVCFFLQSILYSLFLHKSHEFYQWWHSGSDSQSSKYHKHHQSNSHRPWILLCHCHRCEYYSLFFSCHKFGNLLHSCLRSCDKCRHVPLYRFWCRDSNMDCRPIRRLIHGRLLFQFQQFH